MRHVEAVFVILVKYRLTMLSLRHMYHQIVADWMANPDSNSLQYNDFVTNFASSSFVDVLQHRLTEYPDQVTYGT